MGRSRSQPLRCAPHGPGTASGPDRAPVALEIRTNVIALASLPLRRGAVGPDVADLQRRLSAAGHPCTDAPGEYGESTRAAVRRFQEHAGLEPDGDCDAATWAALVETEFDLGARLLCLRSPMMRGDDVAELQLRLGALGFDAGRVDGILGPMTQAATGEFQRNAGLVCDEVCGPETVAALHRLEGRGGDAPVTGVRERDRLRRRVATGTELRVAIGRAARPASADPSAPDASAADPAGHLVSGLAAGLRHWGASTELVDGPWSDQADAVNRTGADVYIAIVVTPDPVVEVAFFSTPGYESHVGRRLAETVVRELPAAPGWSIGVVRGMRTPILRETRPPAVVVKIGDPVRIEHHVDLVIASLQRAVQRWSTELD